MSVKTVTKIIETFPLLNDGTIIIKEDGDFGIDKVVV